MTELRADFAIFKERAFLLGLFLACSVLVCTGGVYVVRANLAGNTSELSRIH